MKQLLFAVLMTAVCAFSVPAFANQENILTVDACTLANTAAQCANVTDLEFDVKFELCTIVDPDPNVENSKWQAVATVAVHVVTYTHSNQTPGDYCYRAYYTNPTTGRGLVSNLAYKAVPFLDIDVAPANLR